VRGEEAAKAARLEVLDALVTVFADIPGLVELIASSAHPPEAVARVRERYGLSEAGADAVLSAQLGRLTAIGRERIVEERDARAQELGET
jgi:DNA gyrase subunit A